MDGRWVRLISYPECLVGTSTWNGSQGRYRCLHSGMADSGTHPLHTHSSHPDILEYTARRKQRRRRNVGSLLETDHEGKWDLKCYYDPVPLIIQLLYVSLDSPHSLLIICARSNSILLAFTYSSSSQTSHFKDKDWISWGLFSIWFLCKTCSSCVQVFPFLKCAFLHMSKDPMTQIACAGGSKHMACIDLQI